MNDVIIDEIYDKFKEECGVFGVFSKDERNLKGILGEGMRHIQHRGQESCGISVDKGRFSRHVAAGSVEGLFSSDIGDAEFFSSRAIGHTRYSTCGNSDLINAQPLLSSCEAEIAVCHNGNIINADHIKKDLAGAYEFLTGSDSEVIVALLKVNLDGLPVDTASIKKAVESAMESLEGSYCVVAMIGGFFVAFRDFRGIRPLSMAVSEGTIVISSEDSYLKKKKMDKIRAIGPGEILIGDRDLNVSCFKSDRRIKRAVCSFEYIYFADPDSAIDAFDVCEARLKLGRKLAQKEDIHADIVIGVPKSGIISGIGFSQESKIQISKGVKKNTDQRSFINPDNEKRIEISMQKFHIIKEEIKGRSVMIVDDSIVRGNAMRVLVEKLKESKAKEIHVRISSPVILSHCKLGIDIKRKQELLSYKKDIEQMKEEIGASSLRFLTLEELGEVLGDEICMGCFCP